MEEGKRGKREEEAVGGKAVLGGWVGEYQMEDANKYLRWRQTKRKVSYERWEELSKSKVICYVMVPMCQALPFGGATEQWACIFEQSRKLPVSKP